MRVLLPHALVLVSPVPVSQFPHVPQLKQKSFHFPMKPILTELGVIVYNANLLFPCSRQLVSDTPLTLAINRAETLGARARVQQSQVVFWPLPTAPTCSEKVWQLIAKPFPPTMSRAYLGKCKVPYSDQRFFTCDHKSGFLERI